MQIWGKIWKSSHMVKDITIQDTSDDTRTHKILRALEKICEAWDLSVPTWFPSNIREFKRTKKVRFSQDNFVNDEIPFDYLEIQVLEEDPR